MKIKFYDFNVLGSFFYWEGRFFFISNYIDFDIEYCFIYYNIICWSF